MSAVRMTRAVQVYWRYALHSLAEGQEVPAGEFADHLLTTGAPVEPLDESNQDPTPRQSRRRTAKTSE